MPRYIDAVTAAETIEIEMGIPLSDLVDCFACMPTADVEPVKHGHWIYNQNGHDWGLGAWECSLCHSVNNNLTCDRRFSPYVYVGSKYCPNCGAKMDGGKPK